MPSSACDPGLPLAHPVGHRAHRHHPGFGAARVHPHVPDGHLLEHHVARRDRDLHRRAGGRRHRRGGERLQEARTLEELGGRKGDFHAVRLEALQEVGPSVFFSLLVIAVAFLPDLRPGRPGRPALRPLAWSKNLTMFIAALLAITLDPRCACCSRAWTSSPSVRAGSRGSQPGDSWGPITPKRSTRSAAPVRGLRARVPLRPAASRRHHRGARCWSSPLSLPALPSSSVPSSCRRSTKARCSTCRPPSPASRSPRRSRVLQVQDRILKSFPEVERSSARPAARTRRPTRRPFSMMETTVMLKPPSEWRSKDRWYSILAARSGSQGRVCAGSGPTVSPGTSWSPR
jgi:hypothetical protein